MKILENNKTVLVKGNVIGFEESTLEPLKYLVQFPDLTTASLSVDMIEDEPQAGHAEEAPRYVRNIIARLRELPLHDREVWLKAIMAEFEQDFSHAKWREGYEQGKFEGAWVGEQLKDADKIRRELNRPVVPQFVADWINNVKRNGLKHKNTFGFYEEITPDDNVYRVMYYILKEGIAKENVRKWVGDNPDIFARAWLDGYKIEKEKRYLVKMKNIQKSYNYLNYSKDKKMWVFSTKENLDFSKSYHTRKELEEAGFGEVFNNPLFEVEEVE